MVFPQQLLQEIQNVALDLQAELIRRGDFVPRHFIKNRSLSSTASELLSPLDISSLSLPLSTHLVGSVYCVCFYNSVVRTAV